MIFAGKKNFLIYISQEKELLKIQLSLNHTPKLNLYNPTYYLVHIIAYFFTLKIESNIVFLILQANCNVVLWYFGIFNVV